MINDLKRELEDLTFTEYEVLNEALSAYKERKLYRYGSANHPNHKARLKALNNLMREAKNDSLCKVSWIKI